MRSKPTRASGTGRLVMSIYRELTGMRLPEVMPKREWRQVDGILELKGQGPRIVEIDEPQHFNAFRSATLWRYPHNLPAAFDQHQWAASGNQVKTLSGVGFGKPCPPLSEPFGMRSAIFSRRCTANAPTLRIAECEVADWIGNTRRTERA